MSCIQSHFDPKIRGIDLEEVLSKIKEGLMKVLKKIWLTVISIVVTSQSYGRELRQEGASRVKDVGDIGLTLEEVSSAFEPEVHLDAEEYVHFKRHHETKKIDISTLDGRYRSFDDKDFENPRNLIHDNVEQNVPRD
jgi:hypothetical protein